MSGFWTVVSMDLQEAQRKKVVLVLGAVGLGLFGLAAATGLIAGLQHGLAVAEFSLRSIQQVITLLALVLGAGALSEQSGIAGLAIRPVSRMVIVVGRFVASSILLTVLVLIAGAAAFVINLAAGAGWGGAGGILQTMVIVVLNGALAAALAMLLGVRLPWMAAAIVAWVILMVSQWIFQLSVLGGAAGLPVPLLQAARYTAYLLPHQIFTANGATLPMGAAEFPSFGWQVIWTSTWIGGLVTAAGLEFRVRDL
jgi:ABC-type transport system involved in multi-copper enzyme maturation permease subunit